MAAFKIHGSPLSTCTRRVALIAKERNVPYEVVVVNLAGGEHKQPPHLQHQPFGQIPYIRVRLCFPLPAFHPFRSPTRCLSCAVTYSIFLSDF